MLEAIEKLLILQDRDRKIRRVQQELGHIGPERETLRAKAAATQTQLDAAKIRVKQIETERKRLELDVEAKKPQIERYANQQLQTRKNEEYRALAHEIELCKEAIVKIEDQEIVLMEQGEAAQKEVARATRKLSEAKKLVGRPDRPTGPARGKFEEGAGRIAKRTRGTGGVGGRSGAGALRTAAQEQGRQRRRGRASRRLRRLPHEIARADSRHLPGGSRNSLPASTAAGFCITPATWRWRRRNKSCQAAGDWSFRLSAYGFLSLVTRHLPLYIGSVLEGRRIASGASRGRKVRTPKGAMPRNPGPFG